MQTRAHPSTASSSRWHRSSRSSGSAGSRSSATSTRTWCSDASASSPTSCRCSETTETSSSSGTSACASSSSSAGVASRPAKTPKLTRISRPGTSCVRVTNASSGSMAEPLPGSHQNLTLSRLPAEAPQRYDDSPHRPHSHHTQCPRPCQKPVPAEVDRLHDVDEVLERQCVADRAQEARIAPRRAERAGEERHRQGGGGYDRGQGPPRGGKRRR